MEHMIVSVSQTHTNIHSTMKPCGDFYREFSLIRILAEAMNALIKLGKTFLHNTTSRFLELPTET